MAIIVRFIKVVFKITLIVIGTLTAAILALILWLLIVPYDSVYVDLPTLQSQVKISRRWGITGFGDFKMVVWTSNGSVGSILQQDFDVNSRTSLYSTPKGDLVALNDGGYGTFISFPEDESPFEIFQPPYSGPDSEAWTYLGAIDVNKQDKLVFFSPLQQRECYAMLGAGESPFRKKHQVEHFCENP